MDMKAENDHNKIITKAAREILKPSGLFQKGSSRTWIDDNGWFLTVVEFQPSGWDKGSYLNIAVNFLWCNKDYLSFDFAFKDVRQNGFVSFDENEEKFYQKMTAISELALKQVMEYRKFSDINYARKIILKMEKRANAQEWNLYNKMMLCGLANDPQAVRCFEELTGKLVFATVPWQINLYEELNNNIKSVIYDTEKFYAYVVNKIAVQRDFWRSKSSMKKLKEIKF